VYIWWVAQESYDDVPRKEIGIAHEGHSPPLTKSKEFPFVGKTVEDAAAWLRNKPDVVELDAHYFAVLDKTAETDGAMVICRIGGPELKDSEQLDCVRQEAGMASLFIRSIDAFKWDQYEELHGTVEVEY